MYKVLLVDDEPLILSGIKFLLDWEKQNCEIIGTARNGQQALEEINRLCPNIVICDISMPVLSGVEVLKQTCKTHPEVIFIMLTNYQDFDLAREALRFQAVDYLLKTQLESEVLEKSLSLAKKESDRRRQISKVSFVEDYINTNKASLIGENVLRIFVAQEDTGLDESYQILREHGVLTTYAALEFIMDFSRVPNLSSFTDSEKKRIFEFEKDLIVKLVGNFFPQYSLIPFSNQGRSLVIFVWNLPSEGYSANISKLYDKLDSASDNVTQARLSLLVTEPFSGETKLRPCFEQQQEMADYYYWNECPFLAGRHLPAVQYTSLNLSSQINRLSAEIRSKNILQAQAVFEKISQDFSNICHRRDNGVALCVELCSVISSVMASLIPDDSANRGIDTTSAVIQNARSILTKTELLSWLHQLKDSVLLQLEELCSSKLDIIEKAREYILKNIDKRILLQDVADFVNISPSYLSSLFKKQFSQNFVDYVNREKTERACELIREDKYLIYEISYMLGFENAYYFTKVFKRHTGLTPTEYQNKVKKPSGTRNSPES